MFFRILLPLLILCHFSAAKEWRDSSGNNSIEAAYLSSDGVNVTLQFENGKTKTYKLSRFHKDDQAWVAEQEKKASGTKPKQVAQGTAFGSLNFGDSRTTVEKKLKESTIVETKLEDNLLGRTGLNGIYFTKQKVGQHLFYLFFDWTKGDSLKRISLQTKPVQPDDYGSLKKSWSGMIEVLNNLHGQPVQSVTFPKKESLEDGLALNTHLWRTENGHSVTLGTGQEGRGYVVTVQLTSELINPNRTTGPGGATGTPTTPVFPD